MNKARAAAVVTWVYVVGFGVAAMPVAVYQRQRGHLPSFLGMFNMFEGPWAASVSPARFRWLLAAFSATTAAAAVTGVDLWHGRRRGAAGNLALLPVEAAFWMGFALPIPVLIGVTRLALLSAAWKDLDALRQKPRAARDWT